MKVYAHSAPTKQRAPLFSPLLSIESPENHPSTYLYGEHSPSEVQWSLQSSTPNGPRKLRKSSTTNSLYRTTLRYGNFIFGVIANTLAVLIPRIYDKLLSQHWFAHALSSGIAVNSQWKFVQVIIDIFDSILPTGAILVLSTNNSCKIERNRLLTALLLTQFIVSFFLSLLVYFFPEFILFIGRTPPEIATETVEFLRLRAATVCSRCIAFCCSKILLSGKKFNTLLGVNFCLTMFQIVLDFSFLSKFAIFSTDIPLFHVVIYIRNWIHYLRAMLLLVAVFYYEGLFIRNGASWAGFTRMWSIGIWQGASSLIKKICMVFLNGSVNKLGADEMAGYTICYEMLTTLMVPIQALGENCSVYISRYLTMSVLGSFNRLTVLSHVLSVAIMGILEVFGFFVILIPFTMWASHGNESLTQFATEAFVWLSVPFVLFAVSNNWSSLFIGTGETRYILLVTCVNMCVIFPVWFFGEWFLELRNYMWAMSFLVVMYSVEWLVNGVAGVLWYRKCIKRIQQETI